jgi:hypothetical protein
MLVRTHPVRTHPHSPTHSHTHTCTVSHARCGSEQIAVEGCGHGELDAIYAALQETERREGIRIDLLLCCGDFEVQCPPTPRPKPPRMAEHTRP